MKVSDLLHDLQAYHPDADVVAQHFDPSEEVIKAESGEGPGPKYVVEDTFTDDDAPRVLLALRLRPDK
jgi:hypothetical protein